MPGGPYDLWREGEESRRVKDLAGAFAHFPNLPKMLRPKEVLDTVVDGVRQGTWVARLVRPDRSARTFWRAEVDEAALEDPALEVLLPEAAELSEIAPELLAREQLPGLWSGEEISAQDLFDYFAGGHTVSLPREGYEEILQIPKCEPAHLETAILQAVEKGIVWLTSGPASILDEPVPAGVLTAAAKLRPRPEPIEVSELMAESIPDAWKEGKANALALAAALSARRGVNLPWTTVRSAIASAIRARWIEPARDSAEWPCDLAAAQHVIFQVPAEEARDGKEPIYGTGSGPRGLPRAEAVLEADRIQDLADQVPKLLRATIGNDLKFTLRVEVSGESTPSPEAIEKINQLLAEVSDELRLE